MEDHERAYAERMIDKLQREANWLKEAYTQADIRDETLDLLKRHFESLRTLTALFIEFIQEMSVEEYGRLEQKIKPILEILNALQPHADEFNKLYRKLPNRFDMYLATVEPAGGVC